VAETAEQGRLAVGVAALALGADAEELDHFSGVLEGVGDDAAVAQVDRSHGATFDLCDERPAAERTGGVQMGEAAKRGLVCGTIGAEDHFVQLGVHFGLLSG
jgi:hypothetical protein